jgi:anti-anti-sigma factor
METTSGNIEELKKLISEHDFGSMRRYSSRITVYTQQSDIPVIRIDCSKIGVAETSQMMKIACDIAIAWNGQFIFDVSECLYLSSLALGAIAKLARHKATEGKRLVFASPSSMVREVIRLSNLDEFINLQETVADAVKLLSDENPALT